MSILTRKLYAEITEIYVTNDYVYDVIQGEVPSKFYDDLKNYYKNDFDLAVEEYGISITKYDCLCSSSSIIVQGHGIYSGRKLHQLPCRLRNEISKLLKKTDINLSK